MTQTRIRKQRTHLRLNPQQTHPRLRRLHRKFLQNPRHLPNLHRKLRQSRSSGGQEVSPTKTQPASRGLCFFISCYSGRVTRKGYPAVLRNLSRIGGFLGFENLWPAITHQNGAARSVAWADDRLGARQNSR